MKRLWLVMAVLLGAAEAFACECGPADPGRELKTADQVFEGTVQRLTPLGTDDSEIVFTVQRRWKGAAERQVTLKGWTSGKRCQFLFEVGKQYVVFANEGRASVCSATAQSKDARPQLERLGPPVK